MKNNEERDRILEITREELLKSINYGFVYGSCIGFMLGFVISVLTVLIF